MTLFLVFLLLMLDAFHSLFYSSNLGELFRDSFCGGGGGVKLTPPPLLELVRILLEIPNLTRKYTPICRLMSAFFFKKLAFFVQKSTFTQSDSVRAVLQIF